MAWILNVLIGIDPTLMKFVSGMQTTIETKLDSILANQEKIMSSLDDVLAATTKETTDIASLSTFVAGLQQQIADALAGVTLPPAVQAKVDAVFAAVNTNDAAVVAAMAANVPPAPAPAPATS